MKELFEISEDGKTLLKCTDNKAQKIVVPNGITTLGEYAFGEFDDLQDISFPETLESIKDEALQFCTSLKAICFPNGLKSIGAYALGVCKSLVSINIPDTVTAIGEYAFSECKSLTAIVIPDGVISIGGLFDGCKSLVEVTLPANLTSITNISLFGNCNNLKAIHVRVRDPQTIIFKYSTDYQVPKKVFKQCTLYVPAGSVEKYRALPFWGDFKNIKEDFGSNSDTQNLVAATPDIDEGDLTVELKCSSESEKAGSHHVKLEVSTDASLLSMTFGNSTKAAAAKISKMIDSEGESDISDIQESVEANLKHPVSANLFFGTHSSPTATISVAVDEKESLSDEDLEILTAYPVITNDGKYNSLSRLKAGDAYAEKIIKDAMSVEKSGVKDISILNEILPSIIKAKKPEIPGLFVSENDYGNFIFEYEFDIDGEFDLSKVRFLKEPADIGEESPFFADLLIYGDKLYSGQQMDDCNLDHGAVGTATISERSITFEDIVDY